MHIKSIITAAVIAAPIAATAQEAPHCEGVGDLAEAVMMHRQNGTPMSTLMAIAEQNGEAGEGLAEIILEAYREPRMSVPDNQRRMVEDFRNEIEAICYSVTR